MTGLILIILAFIIHGIAKAVADYIDFSSLDNIKNNRPKWFYIWTVGDPMNQNAGNPFRCDLWHSCKSGMLLSWAICACLPIIDTWGFVGILGVPILLFLEGQVFTFLYHGIFGVKR